MTKSAYKTAQTMVIEGRVEQVHGPTRRFKLEGYERWFSYPKGSQRRVPLKGAYVQLQTTENHVVYRQKTFQSPLTGRKTLIRA